MNINIHIDINMNIDITPPTPHPMPVSSAGGRNPGPGPRPKAWDQGQWASGVGPGSVGPGQVRTVLRTYLPYGTGYLLAILVTNIKGNGQCTGHPKTEYALREHYHWICTAVRLRRRFFFWSELVRRLESRKLFVYVDYDKFCRLSLEESCLLDSLPWRLG